MVDYLPEAIYEHIDTTIRALYAPEVEQQSHRAYIFARKPI
jgi:hypothetical protein